jgi:hypothetical protein
MIFGTVVIVLTSQEIPNVILPSHLFELQATHARRYLTWAYDFAMNSCPDELTPRDDFGLVLGEDVRFGVKLFDENGEWVATGIGPRCPAEAWTLSGSVENYE